MNTRPAWGMLTVGALIVGALFFSPIWLHQFSDYFEEAEETLPFPEGFYLLSNQAQDVYMNMYDNVSPQMTLDLVMARLEPPVDIEDENLPITDDNPTEVQLLLTGDFNTLDPIRLAGGTANCYILSDGRRLLRLENLDAVNGPDMRVLLTALPRPTSREELNEATQFEIDLGDLKGNQGNQNYLIMEPTFDPQSYMNGASVVLYSVRYDLVFSYASLSPP